LDKIRELRVRFEDLHDSLTDGGVSDLGVDGSSSDVVAKEGPVFLKEPNGPYEARGKNCPHTQNFFVLAKATKELGVHTLVGVRAEDSLIWAGVVGVGIIGSFFEIGTFVVASQNWTSHNPSRCFGLGFYEH